MLCMPIYSTLVRVKCKAACTAHHFLAEPYVRLARRSAIDAQFKIVFEAIRELMAPSMPPKKGRIGFRPRQ